MKAEEHSRKYSMNLDYKRVHQSGDSTSCAAIYKQHSNGAFPQNNMHPLTAIANKHALQNVNMLSWPAGSPDLFPIQHEWNII
ncbi:HTH_Tnp_Tc3_2 domain-containing protein [Trichonephila clavipes]|nr:HTH_Tnp_Tc3_2 domain-containing protein [Trichonephila clavipes]